MVLTLATGCWKDFDKCSITSCCRSTCCLIPSFNWRQNDKVTPNMEIWSLDMILKIHLCKIQLEFKDHVKSYLNWLYSTGNAVSYCTNLQVERLASAQFCYIHVRGVNSIWIKYSNSLHAAVCVCVCVHTRGCTCTHVEGVDI